jgi:protein gp37
MMVRTGNKPTSNERSNRSAQELRQSPEKRTPVAGYTVVQRRVHEFAMPMHMARRLQAMGIYRNLTRRSGSRTGCQSLVREY